MDRRQFLSVGLVTGAAIGLGSKAMASSIDALRISSSVLVTDARKAEVLKLTKKWFEQAIGSGFDIEDKEWEGARIALVEVQDGPRAHGLEQFTTVFRTTTGAQLPPGLYQIKHIRGDAFQVYLERCQDNDSGFHYHATFNLFA